jgi:hypothetical protein
VSGGMTSTLGTYAQCRYQRETNHKNHSLHFISPFIGGEKISRHEVKREDN